MKAEWWSVTQNGDYLTAEGGTVTANYGVRRMSIFDNFHKIRAKLGFFTEVSNIQTLRYLNDLY